MANILKFEKRVAIIGALVEGAGIRPTERAQGVYRNTIMKLGLRVGEECQRILDSMMINLPCRNLEIDEIWSFVKKKQHNVTSKDPHTLVGDKYTFVALDADTRLVPVFRVGQRDTRTAKAFMKDLASRVRNRLQITTDSLRAYEEAIEASFGGDVDYTRVVKVMNRGSKSPDGRHERPEHVITVKKYRVLGHPDMDSSSTAYVERQNLTMRMHCRRLVRAVNGFSKKLRNLKAAIALHFVYYNFVLVHSTLKVTPAMAAGIVQSSWTLEELVDRTT